MTRKTFISLIAATMAATSLGAFGFGSPTQAQNRPDCPGRIDCPITGDLVCRDRCPLGEQAAETAAALPSCCQGRN